ncbi:MAG: SRPBCC family protein [Planctomycetota bacterium]
MLSNSSRVAAAGPNRDFRHSTRTSASAAAIWRVWTEVGRWPFWDPEIVAAELDGAFTCGVTGTLKPRVGRKSRFRITAIESGRSYTLAMRIPFGSLIMERSIDSESPTVFTHRVRFDGLSSPLFAALLGPNFRRVLPGVMDNVAMLAEGRILHQ